MPKKEFTRRLRISGKKINGKQCGYRCIIKYKLISITAGRRATLDKSNNIYNEYERAAALMKEFVQEENFIIPTQSDEIEKALATFRKKFAPEFLANLKDDETVKNTL
jgi:hypothetical protein